jgi:hypothetical protein
VARLRINIITVLDNGAGLQAEYLLLRGLLEELGHDANGVHVTTGYGSRSADLNIWIELADERFTKLAPRNWIFPNPEFFKEHWLELVGGFRVCAKTKDAFEIFTKLGHGDVRLTGFACRDLYREFTRRDAWLHVAGKSLFKGTDSVLQAWNENPSFLPLTVVSRLRHWPQVRGVAFRYSLSEEMYVRVLNEHRYHIIPSAYEGFGHALHEGMAVGATVVTTDASPMNEFGALATVRSRPVREHHLGTLHHVTAADVAKSVRQAVGHLDPDLYRATALRGNERFKRVLAGMLNEVCV